MLHKTIESTKPYETTEDTKIAKPNNVALNRKRWIMRNLTTRHQIARVENARSDIVALCNKRGHCEI